MIKYFKITNIDEIHNNFVYGEGLNCLKDDLDKHNGLYFTTIEYIPKYYYIGIYLREIILPVDTDFKMIKFEDKYRANKIILGKKYSLYDPVTYESFGLNMEYNIHLVNHASEHNHIEFLNQWKTNGWHLKYSTDAIDLASQNGHIAVLDWWKHSGCIIKYTAYAIDWACEYGHENVLNWWFNSGFEIKYTVSAIVSAVKNGHKHILQWWKKNMIKTNVETNVETITTDIIPTTNTNNESITTCNMSMITTNNETNVTIHVMNWFRTNFKLVFLNVLFMIVLFLFGRF